jgi:DNA polymerase-3 subunit delta'
MTPVVGSRQVFLIAQADRLVPQEASPEAANALLKLLEEPPASVQFLLTTVDPGQLLPTVRSRLVPLRLNRLADSEVGEFLRKHVGVPDSDLAERVRAARGSIGGALTTADDRSASVHAAQEIVNVATSGAAARAERSLRQGPWAARGDFTAMLDQLGTTLSEAARLASGAEPNHQVPETLTRGQGVPALVEAARRVAVARERAQGNINPQLLLAVLTDELAEVL